MIWVKVPRRALLISMPMETKSQLARFGLFDARVPRYTSYPTAPHFAADVGSLQMENWIRAIPAGSQISLYVHVPFCRRLCWFCACRTQGTTSDDPVRAYAEVLKTEIALLKSHLAPGITLSRLHWGGGTPTLMPADMMTMLTDRIFEAIPLGEGAEFSVEIDPNEIDEPRLDALAAAGTNRASIGVQDFDTDIQKTIGRDQTYEVTKRAAEMIRARGVTSLNTDILYGLPHQTTTRIADSVQKLLSLSPDRVALYGYAHVPWMKPHQRLIDDATLPDSHARFRQFEAAAQGLAGRLHLGLAHPGLRVRNLALQIGQVYGIVVYQCQVANASRCEVQGNRRTQATDAYDQGPCLHDALLAFDANFVEQDVARVAQQLRVIHVQRPAGRSSTLNCPWALLCAPPASC